MGYTLPVSCSGSFMGLGGAGGGWGTRNLHVIFGSCSYRIPGLSWDWEVLEAIRHLRVVFGSLRRLRCE